MVAFDKVQSSNSQIANTFPDGLVGVFIGATNGIGEATLKQFAKYVNQPRAYFTGRSQEAGDRITAECKALNPNGQYAFIKADTSLIRNVDDISRQIQSKEQAINLLFLSSGTLQPGIETSEGVHLAAAITYYSRARFIANLLPQLQNAKGLRRVVTTFAGGKEGSINTSDWQGRKVSNLFAQRGHAASLISLNIEAMAKKAPDVSFIHDFPGPVKSGIARGTGLTMIIIRTVFTILGLFMTWIPVEESGERHLFLATSARYPAKAQSDSNAGVPLVEGVDIAQGTDGKAGSGVYLSDEHCEWTGSQAEDQLNKLKQDGMIEIVWEHTQETISQALKKSDISGTE